MTPKEIRETAREAVKALLEDRGKNATFTFDEIWQYSPVEVPSKRRSPVAKALKDEGVIKQTGEMVKARTETRRSNEVPEYRAGPALIPEESILGEESIGGAITAMEAAMNSVGFIISAHELANFYLAMLVSPLVILAGLSGTGKSRLPRLFAKFMGSSFYPISVQPQWADNADLLGYTSALNPNRFVEGRLTEALRDASRAQGEAKIVLLDEMNLAPVEHYFSDFLSVIESRERASSGAITTDPLPLDLPREDLDREEYAGLRSLRLPPNLFIVGTANMDETTRVFSPKVLDRAFTIEFDQVDLTQFPSKPTTEPDESNFQVLERVLVDHARPITVLEASASAGSLFECTALLLEELRQILKPAEISFGYRSRDAILLYLWHWQQHDLSGVISLNAAMDFCILQKVLPKISGTGDILREVLDDLHKWLETTRDATQFVGEELADHCPTGPFVRSAAKVEQMLYRLDNEGATTYWVY